jgi:DNA-directed RNA polymerase sigma subunit (sigma70/sigma32)
MSDDKLKTAEALRKEIHAALAALTPTQAKELRARFGLDPAPTEDEKTLHALARELAMRKKLKPS